MKTAARNALLLLSVLATAATAETPSEMFVREAREKYPTPEYARYSNTLVRKYARPHNRIPHAGETGLTWVHVPCMCNIRDLGGWNGLRMGRAYRGSQLWTNETGGVSHEAGEAFRRLGVKTDLDLRLPNEEKAASVTMDRIGLNRINISVAPYMEAFRGNSRLPDATNAWKQALKVFADESNYPIYFHCKAGADRTGTLAFFLEGLCGVPEEDISIDYELTSFAGRNYERIRNIPKSFGGRGRFTDQWRMMVDLVKSYPGKTLADRFAATVKARFGLTDEDIAAIRRNLANPFPREASEPVFSPDGRRFAFTSHKGGIFRIGIFTPGENRTEWLEPGPGQACHPAWTPDGSIVYVYNSYTNTAYNWLKSGSQESYNIWRWKDGVNTRLTRGRWYDSTPSVSPDGKTLYFISDRGFANSDAEGIFALYSQDLATGDGVRCVRRIPGDSSGASVSQPAISPDGRLLARAETEAYGGNWRIMISKVYSPDRAVCLTPARMAAYAPRWTADGRHLLVTGYRVGDPGWSVYAIEARTGTMQRICDGREAAPEPDGSGFVYETPFGNLDRRDFREGDLPQGGEPISRVLPPERVLWSGVEPERDRRQKLDPAFNTKDNEILFVRARIKIDGKMKSFEHFFVATYDESDTGFQLYTADGKVYFSSRRPNDDYIGATSIDGFPENFDGTVTGVRTRDALYLKIGDAPAILRRCREIMSLDHPQTFHVGIPRREGRASRPFTGKIFKLEYGTGWPANMPTDATLEEVFK